MHLRFPLSGLFALSLMLLVCASPEAGATRASTAWHQRPHVPGEVILKFKNVATKSARSDVLKEMGGQQLRSLGRISALHWRLEGMTVQEAIQRFGHHPLVEYIEPNYLVSLCETPDDPLLFQQWGLLNTGQDEGLAGADVAALHAWDVVSDAGGVVVAIVDSGIDYDHPDLADRIYQNGGEIPDNGFDDDGNGYVDDWRGWNALGDNPDASDPHGHGTVIAGIIGASGDNGIGIAGVCWQVQLLPVKWASSNTGEIADLVAAVLYANTMSPDIINCSFGWGADSQALRDAIQDASDLGILVVCAAGNLGRDLDDNGAFYPASYDFPNIVSVAASRNDDTLAGFSNWGATSVDLAAPGVLIFSTEPNGQYGLYHDVVNGSYGSGTSFAAPFVAGVLALLKSRFPDLTAAEAKARLLATVEPVPELTGLVSTGGRLNAFLAVADPDGVPPAAIADLTVAETASNWVTLEWTASGDDGASGRASRFDLRYATFAIDQNSFAAAVPVADAPDPLPAGSRQSARIEDLQLNTRYYFAVKVLDEWGAYGESGNVSLLSNVATSVTLAAPRIEVPADLLSGTVRRDSVQTVELVIANAGPGVLDFAIEMQPEDSWLVAEPSFGSLSAGADQVVAVSFLGEWLPCGERQAGLDILSNDPSRPLIGIPVQVEVVGPADVEVAVGGVEFSPTVQGSSVIDTVWVYNQGCESLAVGGVLTDHSGFAAVEPGGFEVAPESGYPLLVRFTPHALGDVDGVLGFGTNDPDEPFVTVALRGQGVQPPVIAVTPETLDFDLYTGAVSLQALTIHNGGGFDLNFDVAEAPAVDWLSVATASGTVAPGDSATLSVLVRALYLCEETYGTSLSITSDDPVSSEIAVPVSLFITGAGNISLTPDEIDFGEVIITDPVPAMRVVSISNTGCDPHVLTIAGLSCNRPEFYVQQPGFTLSPGESRNVRVFFDPELAVDYFGRLTVESDDPDQSIAAITLLGVGLWWPGSGSPLTGVPPADLDFAGHDLLNVPNPFNPSTSILFRLPRAGRVEVRVYDLRGRLIRSLGGGVLSAGLQALPWHGRDEADRPVPSGIYFGRLYLDGRPSGQTRRMNLVK